MPISKRKRAQMQKEGKWFEKGKSLNWHMDDGQARRRAAALATRQGNALKTAKALQSLSNVNIRRNPELSRKAAADAEYFFRMHRRTGK